MEFDIRGNPDYGDLTISLGAGESVLTEAGAMSRMSAHLQVEAKMIGGMGTAVIRKLLGGESLFLTRYTASAPGFVSVSPTCPGSVIARELKGESFLLTAGSFMACTPGIELSTQFGGLKAFFSGEGAFVLECKGTGTLFFNSYGAVIERQVNGEMTVDTGHVVGWEPTLNYEIRGMGGLKSTFLSGEGLVMAFRGTGALYVQTRHIGGLVGWLSPYCR